MIGTISIECNAKNPNMPLHPLRAYVGSPSSLRIINVPKKIGNWQIKSVTLTAVYPDASIQTASCVLVGGVWVGTIAGCSTAGSNQNGYTIYASGVDENGLDVEGYVLGKGDVVVLESNGQIPENAIAQLSAEVQNKRDYDDMCIPAQPSDTTPIWFGDIECDWDAESESWKSSNGLVEISRVGSSDKYEVTAYSQLIPEEVVWIKARVTLALPTYKAYVKAGGTSPDILIRSFDGSIATENYVDEAISNISAELELSVYTMTEYVDGIVAGKADVSSLNDYYTKSETSSNIELDAKFETKADLSTIPTKTSDLSNNSGFIKETEVSALYSSTTSVRLSVDQYGTIHENKLVDEIGVWRTAGVYIESTKIDDYWVTPFPTVYDGGLSLSGFIQDRAGKYPPKAWSTSLGSLQTYDIIFDYEYYGRIIRINARKFKEGDIPVWVETGRISADYNHYPVLSVSQLVNDSGYLTAHQPLTNYYTKNETSAYVDGEVKYDNIQLTAVQLEDRAVQHFALSSTSTTLMLPALTSGKTNDFVLDVTNDAGETATFSLSGTIGVDFNILVPEGESFAEMTTVQVGEIAEYYLTKTAFDIDGLPTWKVVKQTVEQYTI